MADAEHLIDDLRMTINAAIKAVDKPAVIVDRLEIVRAAHGLTRDQWLQVIVAELVAQSVAASVNHAAAMRLEGELDQVRARPSTGTPYL